MSIEGGSVRAVNSSVSFVVCSVEYAYVPSSICVASMPWCVCARYSVIVEVPPSAVDMASPATTRLRDVPPAFVAIVAESQ